MEDKQLDFNQPLLSVRRLSLTGVLPSKANEKSKTDHLLFKSAPPPMYKSDMKSGSMRHPGTVPFLWEKAPGRPKDENQSQAEAIQWNFSAPKLPPGRVSQVKQPPQTDQNKEERGNYSSQDGDEVFLDAFDTLSQTESLLMNCSITGLSSFDGPEFKPEGTFVTDRNTRDFMIDRFLPAAKAIASEAPQHIIRKQAIHIEQPRERKQMTSHDKQHPCPINLHMPNYLPPYEVDEDDNYEEQENSSAKVCGLFPRFCLKSSFFLLNPLRGMRNDRFHASSSTTSENFEKRSVYELSQSPLHEEEAKHGSDSHCKGQRNFRELLADKSGSVSPVAEKTLYIDSIYEVKHGKSSSSHNSDNDDDTSLKKTIPKETSLLYSSAKHDKYLNAVDEMKTSKPKILEPIEAFFISSERSICEEEVVLKDTGPESMNSVLLKSLKDSGIDLFLDSISVTSSKVCDFDKFSSKHKQESIDGPARSKVSSERKFNQRRIYDRNSQLLAPPLLKSPSDSWLKRTLQTVPPRNLCPAVQNP